VLSVHSVPEAYLYARSPEVAMRTSVSRLFPNITVRPESFWGAFFAKMNHRRDASLGDDRLDALFLVDTDRDGEEVLDNDRIRRGLHTLVTRDIPTLTVGDGLCTVRWSFEPDWESLDAALSLLLAIRSSRPSCRLLRIG
jgi:hypothetical protein